jgi:GT2 family glycosyltransferase
MNSPIMITVLCGNERDGWIAPGLMDSLLAALHDGQKYQRAVALDLTVDYKPIANARNTAVAKFLQSPCQWLVQIDNDQFPQFRILDLIKAAESEGKFIVAAPTPCVGKQGLSWNATATGPADFYRKLPGGWFQPFLIGSGFLAVHRAVFEKLTRPWFDSWCEDFVFCVKAQDAGLKVWSNSGYVCSHMKTFDLLSMMERTS